MAMQGNQSVATDETRTLISSDKVEGTAVYNREGEKLRSPTPSCRSVHLHTAPTRRRTGAIAAGDSRYTTTTARALTGNRGERGHNDW